MNFEDWYDENLKTMLKEHNLHSALEWAWQVAQEAERERVTAIMVKQYRDNYAKSNEAIKTAMRAINEQ